MHMHMHIHMHMHMHRHRHDVQLNALRGSRGGGGEVCTAQRSDQPPGTPGYVVQSVPTKPSLHVQLPVTVLQMP